MKSTTSIVTAAAALLLLTLPGCSTVNTAVAPTAAPAEKAAVAPAVPVQMVNGVAITRTELDRAMMSIMSQAQMQPPLPADTLKQLAQTALDQLTSVELLYQESAKVQVKDLDQQVAKQIADGRAKYPSDSAFEQALRVMGLSVADVTLNARKNIVINAFIEQRFGGQVSVSDAEAEQYFKDNQDKYFTTPENVRASHILIKTDAKGSAEAKQQAKEKAEALLKRIKAGEDFATLAKTESGCPSAPNGGDLGSFGHGKMVPAFDKAAFALKTGEVSDVVETQFGYHIIKVTEKHEAAKEKFADLKDKIVDYLKKEKVKKLVMVYLEELRSKAKIEKV